MNSSKKPKTVFFVRHAESIHNIKPVFQSFDAELSENGKKQAEIVASRLTEINFDLVISSGRKRANQTAEIINNKLNKKMLINDLFQERIKPSLTDGKSWHDKEASKIFFEWEKSLTTSGMRVLEGENYDDLIKRAGEALDYLLTLQEQLILVVTHGYFLKTMISLILHGDKLSEDIQKRFIDLTAIYNSGITIVNYNDDFRQDFNWRLISLNDISHLKDAI